MITRFIKLLLLILFAGPGFAEAQVPIIQWQKTYGGNGDDRLVSVQKTSGGGYILAGSSKSGVSGEKTTANQGGFDYWIMKIDPAGNSLWQRTYGGAHDDMMATVVQTADSGYLLVGYSESGATGDKTGANMGVVGSPSLGRDFWLIKLDATGNIVWQKTYGTEQNDMCFAAIQLPDGGYMIAGLTAGNNGTRNLATAPSYGQNDHWMLRLDAGGNLLWQKSNGGSNHDQIYGMAQLPDGGYVAGGSSISNPSGTKTTAFIGLRDNWVVRTDSAGVIKWQQEVAGSGENWQIGNTLLSGDNGISVTAQGEILVGNRSTSGISGNKTVPSNGSHDYWIVALDSNSGAFNWQLGLGGSGYDELNSVFQTADGGYFAAGHSSSGIGGDKTESSRGGNDFWVVKTNAARSIEWQRTIGGNDDDQLMTALQTDDGWFLLAGQSSSGISGEKDESCRGNFDWWVVKLGPCDTTPTRISAPICVGGTYKLPAGNLAFSEGVYYDTLRNAWNTCDSVIITTLYYYPGDDVHLLSGTVLGNDTSICAGQSLKLQASYTGGTYSWSTGAAGNSIQVGKSGSYSVRITSPNGCQATDTIDVVVHPLPDVNLGADTGVCDKDLPYLLHSVQPPGAVYRWSNGLTLTQIEATRSALYWLEVEHEGCISRDSMYLEVVPTPVVWLGQDTVICEQFPLRIGTEITDARYAWNTGAASPYMHVKSTGQYILEINLRGCIVRDTMDIIAMPVPEIDLGQDRDICAEQTIILDGKYETGSHYTWNTGDTASIYIAGAPGTYSLKVVSMYGCTASDTILLTHYPEPTVMLGPDTSVCEETPFQLVAWTINADSVLWSDGNTGNAISIHQAGRYIAMAVNKCGMVNDTILVNQILCDIWLPNAFTPNGDGVNDIFRVLGNTGRLEGFRMGIYNRWGEAVFYTSDKYKGWDGYHKNLPGMAGTYVYILDYSIKGQPYRQSGSFHLLR